MMEDKDIQQHLAKYIIREIEYWDFWGAIRIVKNGKPAGDTPVWNLV